MSKMNKAVAMQYKAYENNAPKVIAKGSGEVAKKIIEKAKEYEISIFQNSVPRQDGLFSQKFPRSARQVTG